NAWEEGDEVVMVACRTANPIPTPDPANGKWAVMMANLKLFATLHEWRFNLETGETKERQLDDQSSEFPMINLSRLGQPSQYSYNQVFADTPTLRFDGVRKYDTTTGQAQYLDYGDGRFGSESPFAKRDGATAEDDGYLLSFVHDERENQSELVILNARDLSTVARLRAPTRIPLGFHACWAPADGGQA
ncbi:MAG: carotenoid oxygenase family protein, partial [Deltaproteobacteria bacterium]|nr:carotenoid oxygenase family protein [Deltaproteobacteria bacterium]